MRKGTVWLTRSSERSSRETRLLENRILSWAERQLFRPERGSVPGLGQRSRRAFGYPKTRGRPRGEQPGGGQSGLCKGPQNGEAFGLKEESRGVCRHRQGQPEGGDYPGSCMRPPVCRNWPIPPHTRKVLFLPRPRGPGAAPSALSPGQPFGGTAGLAQGPKSGFPSLPGYLGFQAPVHTQCLLRPHESACQSRVPCPHRPRGVRTHVNLGPFPPHLHSKSPGVPCCLSVP